MAIVVLRPSHLGWDWANDAAPVSAIGMYGLSLGVFAPGAFCGSGVAAPSIFGSSSSTSPSTSTALTEASFAAFSALSRGSVTLR